MPLKSKPLVTHSLARQIADKIQQAIIDGELAMDERLPTEPELAAQFSVSRPTIREALKRLAAKNLIRSRRGPTGGTFVHRPSEDDARHTLAVSTNLLVSMGDFDMSKVFEARRQLESACLPLAVANHTDHELNRMAEELVAQRDDLLSDVDFCASDVRFHRALVDATQNPVMQYLMTGVIEALQPVANMIVFRYRERGVIVPQHQRLFEAIKERNLTAAQAVFTEQMDYLATKYAQAEQARQLSPSA